MTDIPPRRGGPKITDTATHPAIPDPRVLCEIVFQTNGAEQGLAIGDTLISEQGVTIGEVVMIQQKQVSGKSHHIVAIDYAAGGYHETDATIGCFLTELATQLADSSITTTH